jgi:hypothetical protein
LLQAAYQIAPLVQARPFAFTRALALTVTFFFQVGRGNQSAPKVTNPGKNYILRLLVRQCPEFDKLLVFNELLCLAVQMHEIKPDEHTIC